MDPLIRALTQRIVRVSVSGAARERTITVYCISTELTKLKALA